MRTTVFVFHIGSKETHTMLTLCAVRAPNGTWGYDITTMHPHSKVMELLPRQSVPF